MFELRTLDRENLAAAYGLDSERLLPWPALNAPFDGAWCVLRGGNASTPHSHHEYEIFIAMAGRAALTVNSRTFPFAAGDIAHLPPGCTHQVVNDGQDDFEYYSIWWDAEMASDFLTRYEEQSK